MLVNDNEALFPLEEGDLEVGMKLPWTVFSESGQLLMREGAPVDTQRKLDSLMNKGFRHRERKPGEGEDDKNSPPPNEPQPKNYPKDVNPFVELDEIGHELKVLFERIEEGTARPGQIEKRFYEVASEIQGLMQLNTDALLGAVHLSSEHPYIVQHPLHVTIIAALIAQSLKIPQKIQLSMLAASLTQNIGMNSYQMRLHAQKEPLSKRQLQQVQAHPVEGAKLLNQAGVEDRLWLQIVYQHHEKTNGEGYPKGIEGTKIRPEARIVALGDVYSALVTGRPYRPGLSAQQSLRSIFLERGKQFDPKLTQVFLGELGLYPPGACVQLKNNEVALVTRRTSDARAPLVTSFMDVHGELFMHLKERNTAEPGYAILKNVSPKQLPRLNPTLLWGIKLKRLS